LALIALCESGFEERPEELDRTANYLRKAQHPWGGWSDIVGVGWPTSGATGWAVKALHSPGLTADNRFKPKALEWLLNNQLPDGGWAVDRGHPLSTIGKTCDALMGLSRFGAADTQEAKTKARDWLLEARGSSDAEQFGSKISIEPQGINPVVENIILFLEAAFYADTKVPTLRFTAGRPVAIIAATKRYGLAFIDQPRSKIAPVEAAE
jgi:hypothetical protein